MQIEKYLKEYQPIIYKTFVNSLQKKQLFHAFLFVGNPGTPLLEVSKYLAKSILCDDPSPLACNNCITCLRIESENYPDVVVLDGSKSTIKKDDVLNIEEKFERHAFERKGIMIYILHLVENMTTEAVNSILKFLEEPNTEVFAFLTTNNPNVILPTIVSRCQTLQLNLIDRNEVIKQAINLGIAEEDAELLSYFYNSGELIFDVINNKDNSSNYFDSKKAIIGLLDVLKDGQPNDYIYYVQSKITPVVKTKENMRFFLDMLAEVFEDLINIQNNKPIYLKSFSSILIELSGKISNVSYKLTEILKQRNLVNLNINSSLQLDHLIINIAKE